MSSAKVALRNGLVFKQGWRGSALFTFLSPILFLSAMGLGVGALVDRGDSAIFGEAGYLAFFSTGMLAAATMNAATFESSFPIMSKLTWQRNYEAIMATPMKVSNIVIGELMWLAARLTMVSVPFFVVLNVFRVPLRPLAILGVPVAILTGLGFGSVIMAYAATRERSESFNGLFRFVITPLFLFSGTFFPLDDLPEWVRWVAEATPLYHGIELIRGFALEGIDPLVGLWHLGYLLTFLGIGTTLAIKNFSSRLID